MKASDKKIISIVLLLLWMGFIFLMSTDFGAADGKPNQTIVSTVKTQTGIDMNRRIGSSSINAYFRKYMHFLEFAVLSLFALNLLAQYNVGHRYMLAFIFSAIYAGTDELHQMYVGSRTALFKDVLIDTSGAALALIIAYVIWRIRAYKNNANAADQQL